MKNFRTLTALLALALLWLPTGFSNAPIHLAEPAAITTGNTCAEDPPSNFHATDITPTSIKLEWTHSIVNLYYFVSGVDLTSTSALPSVVTQNLSYTFAGLDPGHHYVFYIAASSCPNGPTGESVSTNASTLSIIVEDIVNFDNCTPFNTAQMPVGIPVSIGVKASQSTYPNFNQCYRAEFIYQNRFAFEFGFALDKYQRKVYFNELEDPYGFYQLVPVGDKVKAECRFNGIKLFTVEVIQYYSTGDVAEVTLTFEDVVQEFRSCNNFYSNSFSSTSSGSSTALHQGLQKKHADHTPVFKPSPNPFRESITLPYNLPEDGPVAIYLYNSVGVLVRTVENNPKQAAGFYETTIDGAELPTGQYFLQIVTANESAVHAIVKTE